MCSRKGPDQPFARVVLPPARPVAIVEREAVMEAVVTLPERDEGSQRTVARRRRSVVARAADEVGERVDAECRLQHHDCAKEPGDKQTTHWVAPPRCDCR